MNFRNLLLLIIVASLCFGGTFTCKSNNAAVHVNNDEADSAHK
jgi:hypothetical protein